MFWLINKKGQLLIAHVSQMNVCFLVSRAPARPWSEKPNLWLISRFLTKIYVGFPHGDISFEHPKHVKTYG